MDMLHGWRNGVPIDPLAAATVLVGIATAVFLATRYQPPRVLRPRAGCAY
jgi:hypothetical protein